MASRRVQYSASRRRIQSFPLSMGGFMLLSDAKLERENILKTSEQGGRKT